MSINWVMLDPSTPTKFTPLPYEQTLYTSPPRTTLTLSSLNPFPGAQPFSLGPITGTFYLTNQRILFLPSSTPAATTPASEPSPLPVQSGFQSFAAPILNLESSRLSIPWLGPNVWTVLVKPVQGGGLPTAHERLELKITFKDGGAADFQPRFERIKERVMQAAEVGREAGQNGGGGEGVAHLEELPAYPGTPATWSAVDRVGDEGPRMEAATAPAEPPPGYDEVQRQVIEDEFGSRLDDVRLNDRR